MNDWRVWAGAVLVAGVVLWLLTRRGDDDHVPMTDERVRMLLDAARRQEVE